MKKIEVWQTRNGTLCYHKQEAEDIELELKQREIELLIINKTSHADLETTLQMQLCSDQNGRARKLLSDFIIDNRDRLKEILNQPLEH